MAKRKQKSTIDRRKRAIVLYEMRLESNDEIIKGSAKRFRGRTDIVDDEVVAYRKWLIEEIERLRKI